MLKTRSINKFFKQIIEKEQELMRNCNVRVSKTDLEYEKVRKGMKIEGDEDHQPERMKIVMKNAIDEFFERPEELDPILL